MWWARQYIPFPAEAQVRTDLQKRTSSQQNVCNEMGTAVLSVQQQALWSGNGHPYMDSYEE